MTTGKHLKIKSMGEKVLGVTLEGDKSKPEPIHFRVVFPFGDVDVVRCTNGEYWIHTRVNKANDGNRPDRTMGKFIDARLDIIGKHASDTDEGDFNDPDMFHCAVKVGKL